jgi:hypothetical protein
LIPFALARAMPVFVRSLIFSASTFAKDDSSASRMLRTSSLSVARCFRPLKHGVAHAAVRGRRQPKRASGRRAV